MFGSVNKSQPNDLWKKEHTPFMVMEMMKSAEPNLTEQELLEKYADFIISMMEKNGYKIMLIN